MCDTASAASAAETTPRRIRRRPRLRTNINAGSGRTGGFFRGIVWVVAVILLIIMMMGPTTQSFAPPHASSFWGPRRTTTSFHSKTTTTCKTVPPQQSSSRQTVSSCMLASSSSSSATSFGIRGSGYCDKKQTFFGWHHRHHFNPKKSARMVVMWAKPGNNKNKNNNDDITDEDDDDWNEDVEDEDVVVDIDEEDDVVIDEFEADDTIVVDDDDVVVVDDDDSMDPDDVLAVAEDEEDDDEDELDIDEIDLDEEDEEDEDDEDAVIEEEMVGGRRVPAMPTAAQDDESLDWDDGEDDDDGGNYYELEDDPDDPNYMVERKLAEEATRAAIQRAQDEAFDPIDFMQNQMDEEMAKKLQELPFMKQVEELTRDMELTEEDVEGMDVEEEMKKVSAMEDDPYPRDGPLNPGAGLTDDDMEEWDQAYKAVNEILNEEPWDKVMLKGLEGFDGLSNETLAEIEDCLEEVGGSAYNVTNWLLYDLDFNVSNLILAAVKHNRKAPILFQHWYPQLVTYKRYQHARDRNFDFTWDDVEQADISELERYYAGFGYNEIPSKAPAETGIISLEDLDEEEIKMAAFDQWVKDVYNPEGDRTDFDDDNMRDEDNVFSEFYEPPQHPDLPTFEDAQDDLAQWEAEFADSDDDPNIKAYRDMMGRNFEYTVIRDEEFEREFRGHLIIACTGADEDLEIAEKITLRFEKEFGKKVFVETRIMALAQEEDNVYEIWLESYEIDLLHSKKRASLNAKGWDGPAEVDNQQIDYLTERVRFLISDDARYSYRFEADNAE